MEIDNDITYNVDKSEGTVTIPSDNLQDPIQPFQATEIPAPSDALQSAKVDTSSGEDSAKQGEGGGTEQVSPLTQPQEPIRESKEPGDNRRPDGTFGPGNNANPNGRPKRDWTWKDVLSEMANEYITTDKGNKIKRRDLVAKKLFQIAAKGNVQAIKDLMNRTDGMPEQDITSGGETIDSAPRLYIPAEDPTK